MIGMVLVTHGSLAAAFVAVLEHIAGPQKNIVAVAVNPDDDMDAKRGEIVRAIDTADTGAGVLLLTDLFGGTPSNLAISLTGDTRVETLAGINLPMLVKLTEIRDRKDLHAAAEEAAQAGRKYIHVASSLLQATPPATKTAGSN